MKFTVKIKEREPPFAPKILIWDNLGRQYHLKTNATKIPSMLRHFLHQHQHDPHGNKNQFEFIGFTPADLRKVQIAAGCAPPPPPKRAYNNPNAWTPQEITSLRQGYQNNRSLKQIATQLHNRTPAAVAGKAKRLKIHHPSRLPHTPQCHKP